MSQPIANCPNCGASEDLFAAVGTVSYQQGRCPRCGEMRTVVTTHGYSGRESFGTRKVSELGLPAFDLVVGRNQEREIAYLLAGDAGEVLGTMEARKQVASQ